MLKTYYFTFGSGHNPGLGYYTTIKAETYSEARRQMVEIWGVKWSFQYDSAEAAGVEKYGLKHVEAK